MSNSAPPHIALFPTAGMGHLTPFLRIAATFISRGCRVTLITAVPTVSAAESAHITSFLSDHPKVNHAKLQIQALPDSDVTADPFFAQFEATQRTAETLLRPLMSSLKSPPLSALVSDLVVLSAAAPACAYLRIPCYVVCTSSVRFLCVAARLPAGYGADPMVDIPGLGSVHASNLPPLFKNPNAIFTKNLADNVKVLLSSGATKGIFINSFDRFEPEALEAVNSGKVSKSLPKVIPIGPLDEIITTTPSEKEINEKNRYMTWLDDQEPHSVVYVSFGSRTAMSRDQIVELSKGLEKSGRRFIWVLKTVKVDKEDLGGEIEDRLGESFVEKTKERGLVLKGWARQREILGHGSVGLFLSHCGWNSVAEAARLGVPIVAWPLHGDQRLNAEVVGRAGLGVWPKGWGDFGLIGGDEIAEKIAEAMDDEKLRQMAEKVGLEAEKAVGFGGSSDLAITQVLEFLGTVQNKK